MGGEEGVAALSFLSIRTLLITRRNSPGEVIGRLTLCRSSVYNYNSLNIILKYQFILLREYFELLYCPPPHITLFDPYKQLFYKRIRRIYIALIMLE